jgi:hypothetical protein
MEGMRAERKWMSTELSERDKDTDMQEGRARTRWSRYNREYKRCMSGRVVKE